MSQVPVFVISLKRSIDRRASIESKLGAHGVAFQFVDAVDGRELGTDSIQAIQRDSSLLTSLRGYPMQPGEIGCSLTHYKVYEKIVSERIEYCCVLEDDVQFHRDFAQCIQSEVVGQLLSEQPTIILLGHYIWGSKHGIMTTFRTTLRVTPRTSIATPIQGNHGTHGYIVNREAATILLQSLRSLKTPIDDIIGTVELHGIKRLCVTPPVVSVDASFPSLMQERIAENSKVSLPEIVQTPSRMKVSTSVELLKRTLYVRPKQYLYYLALRLGLKDSRPEVERFRVVRDL